MPLSNVKNVVNIWKGSAVADGQPVEFAKDMNHVIMRGATTKADAEFHLKLLLSDMQRKAWEVTGEVPQITDIKVEPVGHEKQTDVNFGMWRPPEPTTPVDRESLIPADKRTAPDDLM